jgi:hypothetical protein
MKIKAWGIFLLPALLPVVGEAHLRNYLDTYGYPTLDKGHAEVEVWTDRRDPDGGDSFWVNQTEVEYGVSDRWTTSLYGVFVDGQGFSALKWENRYRLKEKGVWPVDVALYGEIKKANGRKDENELEGKLILSKDWDRWNVSVNPILEVEEEIEASGDKEWELESALAVGTSYRGGFGPRVTPGVELFFAEHQSRITPGLYMDLMPDVRLNVGAGIGLEKQADNLQWKTILEIEF